MIPKIDFDLAVYAEGRRRLQDWLPSAREDAVKTGQTMDAVSYRAKSVRPFINEANFDALLIHRHPKGGWQVNLLLKKAPPGVPTVMGSPEDTPIETHSDAVAFARMLLINLVRTSLDNQESPAETMPPTFHLYDWRVRLNTEVLEVGQDVAHKLDGADVIRRLKTMMTEICPDGFSPDLYGTWSDDTKGRLMTMIHIAAMAGIFYYPLDEESSDG
jgi:hypothetical protein